MSVNPILSRNNVHITGQGRQSMLFAHGFGCGQQMWRYITPAFEKDYQLILFDYVGAGQSDLSAYHADKYASLQGYAQDVLDIIEALSLKEVVFVGHSVSSMVGLLASLENPEYFSQLIMLGPSPCYLNHEGYAGGFEKTDISELLDAMEANYLGWSGAMAPAIMGNPENAALGEELTESFCSTDPVIARQFAQATFLSDNRADLHKATVPSLLLQCSNDILAPRTVGDYLSGQLPKATLKIMEATGHCPHMSAPEETIRLMKQYLTKN